MPKTLKDMAEDLKADIRRDRDAGVGPETASMNLDQLVKIVHAHLLEHEILDPHRDR